MSDDNRDPGSGLIEKLCWLALLILVAWSLTWTVHALFGGIPADATPGDIWRMIGIW